MPTPLVILVVTNSVLNLLFALTLGFVCYGVLKKQKKSQPKKPDYIRK